MYPNMVSLLFWFLCITENAYSTAIQFTEPEYEFSIYEVYKTEVGQVQVSNDEPEKFFFFYSINDEAAEYFHIDPISGQIFNRVELDREERSEYNISVVATSMEGDVSSPVHVRVYVMDLNDNPPMWIFPENKDPQDYQDYQDSQDIFVPYNGSDGPIARYDSGTSYIPYNAPVGLVVTHLEAEDADIGENARLSYGFRRGHSYRQVIEYFSIDEQTGAISVIKRPGEICDDLGEMVIIDVQVVDHGSPRPLGNSALLYVMLYGCEDYHAERVQGKMH